MIDTIAARATAPGVGGIGIIRISGPQVTTIAQQLMERLPTPRYAMHTQFLNQDKSVIDEGIVLYFPNPHSFTGEDVLELHGHGGPVVMDCLLQRVVELGARLAEPGEFSERAFLNDKIDLTQAEAIADLIAAHSVQAAKSAMSSLQGKFSTEIHSLVDRLIELRTYVEAAIDFSDEEIDFLSDGHVAEKLAVIIQQITQVMTRANQGALLRDGMKIVIAGKPNAGKSSLLNQLSGRDSAIVTAIPGTTRDLLHEQINLDGLPLHITDTAGLRQSDDPIEQEGIRRAWAEIEKADQVLLIVDSSHEQAIDDELVKQLSTANNLLIIHNKIDLTGDAAKTMNNRIYLSAKTGEGMELLTSELKKTMGFENNAEGVFIARRRHVDALAKALTHLQTGQQQLKLHQAGELLAEDLRQAQQALSTITGQFTSDDLLGEIFSTFCVGK